MNPSLQIRFALLSVMIVVTMFTSFCDKPDNISYICQDSLRCIDIGPDEPLQIGVLQALSGAVAPLGQAQTRWLELAMESRDNILFGHPISLQITLLHFLPPSLVKMLLTGKMVIFVRHPMKKMQVRGLVDSFS